MSVPTCLCWFIRYPSLSRPSSTRIIYCLLNVWWLYIKTMCTNQMLLNINWVPEEWGRGSCRSNHEKYFEKNVNISIRSSCYNHDLVLHMHFCSSENVTKKLVLPYKSCNMKYAHEEDLEAKFTFHDSLLCGRSQNARLYSGPHSGLFNRRRWNNIQ